MGKGKKRGLNIPARGNLHRHKIATVDFSGENESSDKLKVRLALVNKFLEVLAQVSDTDPRKSDAIAEYNKQKKLIEQRLEAKVREEKKQAEAEGKMVPASSPGAIPPTIVRLKPAVLQVTPEGIKKE